MVSVFKKRVLAYIADYFVVSAIMWIIAELLYFIVFPFSAFFVYEYMIILTPIIGLAYFILLEKNLGATVGKHLLFLKVISIDNYNYNNKISYKQSIIRNLSKIYWIPIIFDILIGRFTGSSNERILGRLSHSEVVLENMEYSGETSLEQDLSEEDND